MTQIFPIPFSGKVSSCSHRFFFSQPFLNARLNLLAFVQKKKKNVYGTCEASDACLRAELLYESRVRQTSRIVQDNDRWLLPQRDL